jgi:hypothetical protein
MTNAAAAHARFLAAVPTCDAYFIPRQIKMDTRHGVAALAS